MIPALVVLGDAIALFGSWVAVNIKGAVSFRLFFAQVFAELRFVDLIPSLIKTFFFGMAVGLIACYKGYHSNRGTEGVGEASNQSVVIASLLIFFIDMVAVQVTSFFL
jgi:phospholipid/cholesterol/gamma-HCH transport system permease protein